jgi:hypothetical protein
VGEMLLKKPNAEREYLNSISVDEARQVMDSADK